MITLFIISAFASLVSYLLSLLPAPETIPSNIDSALTTMGAYFSKLNMFLPVDTLLTLLSLFITIETGILTYKIVIFVYNKIRGSG